MRIRVIATAVAALAAAPVYAQSIDVTGPRTLTPQMVTCTDLPVTTKPVPRIIVAGPHRTDGRTAMNDGLIVINRFADDGLAIGQRYVAQRLITDPKRFPRPGEGYGDLRATGWVTIRAIDENNALASIDAVCDTVEIGDFLEPAVDLPLPETAFPPLYPDFNDRANIIFGADNRVLFGDGDVFSIDRGAAQGVQTGHRYAIYRDFQPPSGHRTSMLGSMKYGGDVQHVLPLVYMGDVVVLTVLEQTSKVVVTKAVDGIQVGDIVVPRRLYQ
jgi:hypothetical protein